MPLAPIRSWGLMETLMRSLEHYHEYAREQNHASVRIYVRVDDTRSYAQRLRAPCELFTSARKLLELSSFLHFLQLYPVVLCDPLW